MSAPKSHSWTEVRWGVLYLKDENFRKAGSVESAGTLPGGSVGTFAEYDCRYIVSGNPKNRRVVRKEILHVTTEFGWEEI